MSRLAQVVGRIDTFAVFQRDLEGGLLPDVLRCVEMAVLQTLKTKIARRFGISIGAWREVREPARSGDNVLGCIVVGVHGRAESYSSDSVKVSSFCIPYPLTSRRASHRGFLNHRVG